MPLNDKEADLIFDDYYQFYEQSWQLFPDVLEVLGKLAVRQRATLRRRMNIDDVPSPINLREMSDAIEWERTAMQRPFREEYFDAFHSQLNLLEKHNLSLIELGAGSGFLAQHILSRTAGIDYTLLDFSPAMHILAKRRLETLDSECLHYVECDFKASRWASKLSQYDAILTNQAVHELRHKRYALNFFLELHSLLKPDGILLYCDHHSGVGGWSNDQLYMSLEEQRETLKRAGFKASEVLVKGGRALYRAQLEQRVEK